MGSKLQFTTGGFISFGLCLVKGGKIGQSWIYSTGIPHPGKSSKDCGEHFYEYGETFGIGDVITVLLEDGRLSFAKNGKHFGVCFEGFDTGPPCKSPPWSMRCPMDLWNAG